jgi:ribonuclease D
MAPSDQKTSPPRLIEDNDSLAAFLQSVRNDTRLAVDTEAASYHKYHDRVYLVQISTTTDTAIVDPISIEDLSPLGAVLADPKVEITFHDADYDLRVLDRDYGFHAEPLFDTRIAAQLLGEPGVGLGALLKDFFGLELDKKLQRADWSRRPLTAEMIDYAAADTSHLLALRDKLEERLKKRKRLHWAQEEFGRLRQVRWSKPEEVGFLRIRGAKALRGRHLSALRSVYDWRETQASNLDRAPFRVLGNEALLAMAQALPSGKRSLARVAGVPASAVSRYGDDLVSALKEGIELPPEQWPTIERGRRPRTNKTAEARFARLKDLRNIRCKEYELEPGVICPNGTLMAIARAAPTSADLLGEIKELRNWQREVLADAEILSAVES